MAVVSLSYLMMRQQPVAGSHRPMTMFGNFSCGNHPISLYKVRRDFVCKHCPPHESQIGMTRRRSRRKSHSTPLSVHFRLTTDHWHTYILTVVAWLPFTCYQWEIGDCRKNALLPAPPTFITLLTRCEVPPEWVATGGNNIDCYNDRGTLLRILKDEVNDLFYRNVRLWRRFLPPPGINLLRLLSRVYLHRLPATGCWRPKHVGSCSNWLWRGIVVAVGRVSQLKERPLSVTRENIQFISFNTVSQPDWRIARQAD